MCHILFITRGEPLKLLGIVARGRSLRLCMLRAGSRKSAVLSRAYLEG